MKVVGVIPARYGSSRLPGKPLKDICGKPMIWWVYKRVSTIEKLDEVYIIYTRMVNAVQAEAEVLQLLPLKKTDFSSQSIPIGVKMEELALLPTPEAVMNRIVPDYIVGFIYGALVESFSSEQNLRMMAMQAATNSAQAMLHDLSIQYNRVRQAAITQEITEVVAGAKAQKKKKKK